VPPIIPRLDVEKELHARGCVKIKEYAFHSGSLWRTADSKFYFVVPQEVGGWSYETDLRDVLKKLDDLG
jgi:hypothetical protein